MLPCVLPTVVLTGLLVRIAGTAAQQGSTTGVISVNGVVLTTQQTAQFQKAGVQVAPGAYWWVSLRVAACHFHCLPACNFSAALTSKHS